ncbi:hypothetical protein [Bacillus sp. FJAT-49711]|uniref:hypothetical protein n=1 Tax=Bacillus sp. FJAT-49711 TaxID=2833585 RepID=UPI0020169520|nr:hypothetical protein [Bacillus sp. FJAT-49711]
MLKNIYMMLIKKSKNVPYGIGLLNNGSKPKRNVGNEMLKAVNLQLCLYGNFFFNILAIINATPAKIDIFKKRIPVLRINMNIIKIGSIIATLPVSNSGSRLEEVPFKTNV